MTAERGLVELRTFGHVALVAKSGEEIAVPRKALAILAYLAAEQRPVPRDSLVAMLWPEAADHGALNQTLYELRRASPRELVSGASHLCLNEGSVASDVVAVKRAARAESWGDVIAWYRGPFLRDLTIRGAPDFEHWSEARRDELAGLFRVAVEKCTNEAAKAGDFAKTVQLCRSLAAEEPLSGRVATRLIDALGAAGEPAAALAYFNAHSQRLKDELGAAPEPEVSAAAARVRARFAAVPSDGAGESAVSIAGDEAAESRTLPPAAISASVSRKYAGAALPRGVISHPFRRAAYPIATALVIAGAAFGIRWDRSRAYTVGRIDLPADASSRVTFDPVLRTILVDGGASFDNSLVLIDADTYARRVLPHGAGVAVDSITNWYWTADYRRRLVVVLNGRTSVPIDSVPVLGCPFAFAMAGPLTLVAQQCDDRLTVIDRRTRRVVRDIPVATLPRSEVGGAKGMGAVFANPNAGSIYFWKDMIPERLDVRTWTVREIPEFGGPVLAVNAIENRVYAAVPGGLRLIDATTERTLRDIPLGGVPQKVLIGFGGRRAYVPVANGVAVLEGTAGRLLGTVPAGDGSKPTDVAVDESTGRLFVLSEGGARKRAKLEIVRLPRSLMEF